MAKRNAMITLTTSLSNLTFTRMYYLRWTTHPFITRLLMQTPNIEAKDRSLRLRKVLPRVEYLGLHNIPSFNSHIQQKKKSCNSYYMMEEKRKKEEAYCIFKLHIYQPMSKH